jgi:hypothetical protein
MIEAIYKRTFTQIKKKVIQNSFILNEIYFERKVNTNKMIKYFIIFYIIIAFGILLNVELSESKRRNIIIIGKPHFNGHNSFQLLLKTSGNRFRFYLLYYYF